MKIRRLKLWKPTVYNGEFSKVQSGKMGPALGDLNFQRARLGQDKQQSWIAIYIYIYIYIYVYIEREREKKRDREREGERER